MNVRDNPLNILIALEDGEDIGTSYYAAEEEEEQHVTSAKQSSDDQFTNSFNGAFAKYFN